MISPRHSAAVATAALAFSLGPPAVDDARDDTPHRQPRAPAARRPPQRHIERATPSRSHVTRPASTGPSSCRASTATRCFTDMDGVECIDMPGMGGMGVHYVNGDDVATPSVHLRHPEAVVYETRQRSQATGGAGVRRADGRLGERPWRRRSRGRSSSVIASTSPMPATGTVCRRSTHSMHGSGSTTPTAGSRCGTRGCTATAAGTGTVTGAAEPPRTDSAAEHLTMRDPGGFLARLHAELAQDVGHMHARRLGADEQRLGDLSVRLPGQQT